MAVKIKLKRLGRTRVPTYRIVVADARTKRDGRAIEEIGKYHPKEEPSFIEVNSERAQHWLSVGAQPTEPVMTILKITGDWQKFKGEPGAEGTLRTKEPAADKKVRFATALKDAAKDDTATAAPKGGSRARKPDTGQGGHGQGGHGQGGQGKAARRRPTRPRPRSSPSLARPSPRPAPRRRPPGPLTTARPRPPHPARPLRPPRPPVRRRAVSRAAEPEVLEEALEHLVRGIVEHPDDVLVSSRAMRRGSVLEVRVHPDDLGKVIGRGGRTARALRTVMGSLAGGRHVRVDLLDTDEIR